METLQTSVSTVQLCRKQEVTLNTRQEPGRTEEMLLTSQFIPLEKGNKIHFGTRRVAVSYSPRTVSIS